MVAAMFNTLKFANRLKNAGVSPAQAEAQAEILSEVFELNLRELVTKKDLRYEIEKLDAKLEKLELRMILKLTVIMATLLSVAVAFSKLL